MTNSEEIETLNQVDNTNTIMIPCNKCKIPVSEAEFENGCGECLVCFPIGSVAEDY